MILGTLYLDVQNNVGTSNQCIMYKHIERYFRLCTTYFYAYCAIKKCSNRAWKCNFPAFLGNFDRPTDQPINRRTNGFILYLFQLNI